MRISDWSSDVCSSDLVGTANAGAKPARSVQRHWDAPFQRLFIAVWHGSVMATATEHLAKLAVLIDAENMSPKIVSGLYKEIATICEASVRRIHGDFSAPRPKGWPDVLAAQATKRDGEGKSGAVLVTTVG